MRHFLRAALAPGALASSVSRRATVAVLVALPSTAPRLAPAKRRAIPGAVLITAVAVPTDEHLLRAAPAAVHPIRLLACPHPPPAALDNAADCGRRMGTGEQTYRVYSCRRCAQQVFICRHCDRGNQYCAGDCASRRRCESRRRAGQRYQHGYRGASRHAARQRAWRERHAQKVTHQGSPATDVALIVAPTSTTSEGNHADIASVVPPPHGRAHRVGALRVQARGPVQRRVPATARCCFCGCVLPRFARFGPLREGP